MRRGETGRIAKAMHGEMVSGNYFSTFGVGAFVGRTIQPSDDRPTAPPVVMLTYRAWQQEYGSDPSVISSTLIIDGLPFTVIGDLPPRFFGETLRGNPAEIWLPISAEPLFPGDQGFLNHFQAWLRVIDRLRSGATATELPGRLTYEIRLWLVNDNGMPAEWMSGIKESLPKQNIKIVPVGTGVGLMNENYGESLRILLTVCSLVLLIACANIANLLLARGASRRAQTSMRLAFSASRSRLIRQSLTESIVLSLFGGLIGLGVAFLGVTLAFRSARDSGFNLVKMQPQDLGYELDNRVVLSLLRRSHPIRRQNSMPCTPSYRNIPRTFPVSKARALSCSTPPFTTTGRDCHSPGSRNARNE